MEKQLKITSINIFEYFGCGGDLKSNLSDYYVKNHNCVILLATNDSGEQVGLLIYEEKAVIEILYVKANDSFTKKGLLNYLIESSDKFIRYRIVNNENNVKTALDCGFRHENSLNIYRSIDKNHPYASVFLEKYNKLYDLSLKKDCKVKSFEKLSDDELNQIKNNPDNEFVQEFNPAKFLDNNFSDLSKRISTAVIKNDKVVAYSLLRNVGKNKCILEILCVAKSHRKTFVIVPAIMHSLNTLLEEGLTYITFAVYQKNAEMIKIIENNMREAIESVAVQHNMIYIKVRS